MKHTKSEDKFNSVILEKKQIKQPKQPRSVVYQSKSSCSCKVQVRERIREVFI